MSHLTTRDRTVSPDGYAAALRILRRLLAGIERPPALRLGDMLLHELESHPEYTLMPCARTPCSLAAQHTSAPQPQPMSSRRSPRCRRSLRQMCSSLLR